MAIRLARRCPGSTPEDLHSEIALRALHYFPSHDPSRGGFSTWLTRVARTTAGRLREAHRRTLAAVSLSAPLASDDGGTLAAVVADPRGGPGPGEAIAAAERAAAVRAALAALPDDEREAVTARFWTDAPVADKGALARGLTHLRGALVPPDRDDEE